MPKFYIITSATEIADKAALADHLFGHPLKAGERVVEGDEVDVTPEIKITRKGNGTPAPKPAAITDADKARVLLDVRTNPGSTAGRIAERTALHGDLVLRILRKLADAGAIKADGKKWSAVPETAAEKGGQS